LLGAGAPLGRELQHKRRIMEGCRYCSPPSPGNLEMGNGVEKLESRLRGEECKRK